MNTHTKIWTTFIVVIFSIAIIGCGPTRVTRDRADNFATTVAESGAVGSKTAVANCNPGPFFDGCRYRVSASSRTEYRNRQPLKAAPPRPRSAPPPIHDGGRHQNPQGYYDDQQYYGPQTGRYGQRGRPGVAFSAGAAYGASYGNSRPRPRPRYR